MQNVLSACIPQSSLISLRTDSAFEGQLKRVLILANENRKSLEANRLVSKIVRAMGSDAEPQPESRLIRLENLIIMCEPNAGFFEQHAVNRDTIDYLLSRKYNVVLWNYHGFNFEDSTWTILPVGLKVDGKQFATFDRTGDNSRENQQFGVLWKEHGRVQRQQKS